MKKDSLKNEEKKDSVKLSKEKQGVHARGNMMQTALFVLVTIFAVIFALLLGYYHSL